MSAENFIKSKIKDKVSENLLHRIHWDVAGSAMGCPPFNFTRGDLIEFAEAYCKQVKT